MMNENFRKCFDSFSYLQYRDTVDYPKCVEILPVSGNSAIPAAFYLRKK